MLETNERPEGYHKRERAFPSNFKQKKRGAAKATPRPFYYY